MEIYYYNYKNTIAAINEDFKIKINDDNTELYFSQKIWDWDTVISVTDLFAVNNNFKLRHSEPHMRNGEWFTKIILYKKIPDDYKLSGGTWYKRINGSNDFALGVKSF